MARITSKPWLRLSDMRYWFDSLDEGLEREVERRRKLGLPSRLSRASVCYMLTLALVVIQALPRLGLASAICIWVIDGR